MVRVRDTDSEDEHPRQKEIYRYDISRRVVTYLCSEADPGGWNQQESDRVACFSKPVH
jgi:hypothetical protein